MPETSGTPCTVVCASGWLKNSIRYVSTRDQDLRYALVFGQGYTRVIYVPMQSQGYIHSQSEDRGIWEFYMFPAKTAIYAVLSYCILPLRRQG